MAVAVAVEPEGTNSSNYNSGCSSTDRAAAAVVTIMVTMVENLICYQNISRVIKHIHNIHFNEKMKLNLICSTFFLSCIIDSVNSFFVPISLNELKK